MRKEWLIGLVALCLSFSLGLAACGDDSPETTNANADADADGETDADTDADADADADADGGDACPEGETLDPRDDTCVTDTPASCAEINGLACFSNYDCQEGFVCSDLSGEETDVCCVPGERGEGVAGDPCEGVDGEAFCESSICIGSEDFEARCSSTCETAEDCPATMQLCQPIMFSGSEDDWCFPTE